MALPGDIRQLRNGSIRHQVLVAVQDSRHYEFLDGHAPHECHVRYLGPDFEHQVLEVDLAEHFVLVCLLDFGLDRL